MNTKSKEAVICETCHTLMQKKKAEITDLDINRLSLLSMFRINDFYLLQCPHCHKTGLHIV